jgi:hypothetical protein
MTTIENLMTAIIITGNQTEQLSRYRLDSSASFDEKWLQKLLFDNPAILPMNEIEPGAGDIVPLCRELTLTSASGNVFLDILAVTRTGRLCLIECKLWRNPQARREVIAQTLEYAALLRQLSFGDLSAKLAAKGLKGANPIFAAAATRWPEIAEAPFVDAVSRSLKRGDFQLIVAGDGIRSDLHTISGHLEQSGLAAARFSLVEIQLWRNSSGAMVVIPNVPVRTEIIQHRVLITTSGDAIQIAEQPRDEAPPAGPSDATRDRNRQFFDKVIQAVRFDHPDQAQPRHGGNNWIKLPLPDVNVTLYRTNANDVGFTLKLDPSRFPDGAGFLTAHRTDIEAGIGIPISVDETTLSGSENVASENDQREWFASMANKLSRTLRPLLSVLQSPLETR